MVKKKTTKKVLPKHYHDEFLRILKERNRIESEAEALEDKSDEMMSAYKVKHGIDKLDAKATRLRNKIDRGYERLEEIYETVLKLLAKGYESPEFGMEIKSEKSGRPSYKSISMDLCKEYSIPQKAYEKIKDKYMDIKEYMILVYRNRVDDFERPDELKRLEMVEPSVAKKRKQAVTGPFNRKSNSKTGKIVV